MTDFEPSVSDLALYFADDDDEVAAHWVPAGIYKAAPSCKIQAAWEMAPLLEHPVGDDVYYVVNFSKLLGPGIGPVPEPNTLAAKRTAKKTPKKTTTKSATPAAKDLVVIPPDDPQHAYVVRRAVYTDPGKCPEIGHGVNVSDLNFMALNEGAVLCNLPKATNNSGWTCFLLSLLSLKSGQLERFAAAKDKHSYFGSIQDHLQQRK
jgi:hypothetical protein